MGKTTVFEISRLSLKFPFSDKEEQEDLSSEKPASVVRFRRQQRNRRTGKSLSLPHSKYIFPDVRFHSNPVQLPSEPELSEEMRRSLAIPVSERRKFFETIAEYSTPF